MRGSYVVSDADIAEIIIDISSGALDKGFEYKIPDELLGKVKEGTAVRIPFGRGDRELTGYVIGLKDKSEWDEAKLKEIISVADREISTEGKLIRLAAWIREHYGGSMNQAIRTVLPMRRRIKAVKEHWIHLAVARDKAAELQAEYERKHNTARARLIEGLICEGDITSKSASEKYKTTKSVTDALVKAGVIEITDERVYRRPEELGSAKAADEKMSGADESGEYKDVGEIADETRGLTLNEEQEAAVNTVISDLDKDIKKTYLLYGVTGSGKTEVYIRLIQNVVARGEQAIVLIPEIALTHQTVERLIKHFGDRVSVMHSRLSEGERYDQYDRVLKKEVDILVGPRSALFAPFDKLGLIIIDEEHEGSYISEQTPSYHAVEVALERAAREGAAVVLGSATPSVESMHAVKEGHYELLRLKKRALGAHLPEVHIVDMREELKKKNTSVFSKLLADRIRDRLREKEQTMLFLNRRGYAGFVSCRSCGYVVKCEHCDVSMTAHLRYGKADRLICHYCGSEADMPKVCPECGSRYIAAFGLGTEKVTELVQKEFPEAKVLRMDADTTKNKNGHERVLSPFREGEADILVGTQMIVKGHDFPRVTLVGAIAADLSMHEGDYRSHEKTYQLLMQAGGRAGRGELPGEFVIQTYRPEEYCIEAVRANDADIFYDKELAFRSLMGYPPYRALLEITMSAPDPDQTARFADHILKTVKEAVPAADCIGPAPARIAKIKDWHRMVLYIKSATQSDMDAVMRQISDDYRGSKWSRTCRIQYSRY